MFNSLTIWSDLHLEYIKNYHQFWKIIKQTKPSAPQNKTALALLGDLGNPFSSNYHQLMDYVADQFNQIFLIAGNHEFMFDRYHRVLEQMEQISDQYNNVHFLNNSCWSDDQVNIIGSTLWSHISKKQMQGVARSLDYRKIHYGRQTFNRYHRNKLYFRSVDYLLSELTTEPDRTTIVLTHHAPSYQTILDSQGCYIYAKSKRNGANYCSNLDWIFDAEHAPLIWAFGHTHLTFDQMIGHTRLISNPFSGPTKFDPKMKLNIEKNH
jgi:predicted phosphodiesterase